MSPEAGALGTLTGGEAPARGVGAVSRKWASGGSCAPKRAGVTSSPSRSCLCEHVGGVGAGVGKVRALGVSRQVAWWWRRLRVSPALKEAPRSPERGRCALVSDD